MNTWLLLVAMASITFASRYLLLMQSVPLSLGPRVRKLLTYTAPAVLTAMWVPIVFEPTFNVTSIIKPEYLVAAIVAAILSRVAKNPLIAVIVSFITFIAIKQFI